MIEDMMTLAQFIANNNLTMTAEYTDSNPYMLDSNNMDHWRCVIARRANGRRKQMTVIFSMGYGHHGAEPTLADVLDAIGSDAAGIENARGFYDWAAEYGLETDEHEDEARARKNYEGTRRQSVKLDNLLGTRAYLALLNDTERL